MSNRNKSLFSVMLFCIFTLVYWVAAAQQGAVKTFQLNSRYYVGTVPGFFPSIQSAITFTCTLTGATVDIPAGVTPTDTIGAVTGGCTKVGIVDNRTIPATSYSWNGTAYIAQSSSVSPAGPATAIQLANAGVNGLASDPSVTVNTTTHVLSTPTVAAFNPSLALGTGATNGTASDYATFLPQSVGGVTVTNGGSYTVGVVPTVTFSAPGGGGATATGVAVMNQAGTSVAFVHLIGIGNLYTAPPMVTFNPSGAVATATIGRYQGGSFPPGLPWQVNQTVNRRLGPAGGFNPLTVTLNLLSGTDNTNTVLGNYSVLSIVSKALAPMQGGGMFSISSNCLAVGDCVGRTMSLVGRGPSRGEDEATESPRDFISQQNDVAGGVLASISTDAQGANPISVGIVGNPFSFNFYEKSFIMDVTAGFHSPGNIASIGTAPDSRFEFFQGDATAGITTQFGVSTQTTLTAPVDSFVYIGACGSQTATTTQYPISGPSTLSNDGFMTNYQGVGAQGENTNYNSSTGALAGFCTQVASTNGMVPGTLLFIADSDYQTEFTKVISVVDGTHFTAFMRSAHSTGATVNFGGAVGNCIGADMDITPPGTNSTAVSAQVSTQRLCYPITHSLAGDRVEVYTNTEGSSPNNLRTLLPAANTPKIPLVITSPVVTGGVLTGITSNSVLGNANDYTANNIGTPNSGHPRSLPAPVVTVSGCTVAPIITMQGVIVSAASTSVTYAPVIASGGSGCPTTPTFNISSFLPTPFGIYPLAMVYKSEDPTLGAGTVGDGRVTFMPFNTSAMHVGDTIQAGDWWNGGIVGGQTSYNANYLNAMNGRNGDMLVYNFTGVPQGDAMVSFRNLEPTVHYFGSFANNYTRTLATDSLVPPPVGNNILGQTSAGIALSFPPLSLQGSTFVGGAVLQVNCAAGVLQSAPLDPPCLHGINTQYDVFRGSPAGGQGGLITNIFNNPATGAMGVGIGATTWQAPTVTAYDGGVSTTTDVLLMGIVNGGPGQGPCSRYDLMLTSTHAFGQSFGRVCSWVDHAGSTLGDIVFQPNNGGGPSSFSTALTLNMNGAAFTVPITSNVATGTAPISVVSTTVVPNLNASTVGGVSFATPTSITTTAAASDAFSITGVTAGSHCSLTSTNAAAATNFATTFISAKATGSVTVSHAATAGMTYDLVCTIQ